MDGHLHGPQPYYEELFQIAIPEEMCIRDSAEAEAARAAKRAERAAYDAKQARKRAVLKALREQERDRE